MSRESSIFRGQCLNLALQIILKRNYQEQELKEQINDTFKIARQIYDEGLERGFLEWEGSNDS